MEQGDLAQVEINIVLVLSQLYFKLCDCRKIYPELEDILDTKFHLEDCPYFEKITETGIKFENE